MKTVFIDDERFPVDETNVIIRSYDEFVKYVNEFGIPDVIHFDHDLGDNQPTGYDIAKFIVDCDLDGVNTIPDGFTFFIHSQNTTGAKNIKELLINYLRFKSK